MSTETMIEAYGGHIDQEWLIDDKTEYEGVPDIEQEWI